MHDLYRVAVNRLCRCNQACDDCEYTPLVTCDEENEEAGNDELMRGETAHRVVELQSWPIAPARMRYLLFYISPSELFSPVKLKMVSMILFEKASLHKHSNKIYSKNSMSTKFDGKFSEKYWDDKYLKNNLFIVCQQKGWYNYSWWG